ncbi:hypothetical protein [Engelhardtia mirabilis]|uniref:Uncharacterized protein n=1 Tax=Engelhardtia mirabilis TaxID=2528011 RepID=A0A518BI98_9BACT|nr:hypothetical protein Pla133_17850 [Planctomycetes bacterium Pla133]QDV01035.1 hypothetical protein Pla86_17840 [Planctomycetes bacterium Pla86]
MSRGLLTVLLLGSAAVVGAHLGSSIDSAAGAVARAIEVGRGSTALIDAAQALGLGDDPSAADASGIEGVGAVLIATEGENETILVASAVELDGQG